MNRSAAPVFARPAQSWLDRDPAFCELARRIGDLLALQHALQRACPKAPIVVSGLNAGTVTVVVPGAAWATRLRQIEPTLVAALAAEGLRVERLKIRPRRELPPVPRHSAPRLPPPAQALSAIDALAREVVESPLKQALAQLLRHHSGSPQR